MNLFFSAGEPSGDLHGSNLIRALKRHDPTIQITGFGGPKMAVALPVRFFGRQGGRRLAGNL